MSVPHHAAQGAPGARAELAALAAAYREDPSRVPPYARLRRARPPRRRPAPGLPQREASVLVLFGELDARTPVGGEAAHHELDLLLLRRASGLRNHAGEIAFPGGGAEAEDADEVATALREAREETGLDPAGVEVLGTLPVAPTVSNFSVTPVLGWWRTPSPVGVVDEGESAAVFRAPVARLVDPENRRTTVLSRGGVTWEMPAFTVEGGLLWGFTAAIVAGLLDELGWARPWDTSRTVRPPGF